MIGNGHFFVEWKEEFVSQERGHRVVHYYLKDSAGESVLAVIGTERSVRHMFYAVAEEFVSVYGAKSSIHAGVKWRSRREVVDWLTSMLSKQQLLDDRSNSPKHDLAQALDSSDYPTKEFGAQLQGRSPRNLGGHNSDIEWSGVAWTCGKQLKHYPAFCRNSTKIAIQSFVFVMAKGENQYLAYLEDMYEDKRGQKKVKVRWFHRNQEVKGVVLRNAHPKEVFITPYSQVISAECVDGPATVLTREHYEECFTAFPHASSNRIHMCYRQFRSNRVKPFDLRKLRGYFDQPIVSCLNSKSFPDLDSLQHGQTAEEDDEEVEEELSPGENAKLGSKRTRNGRRCEPLESDYSGIGISDSQMLNFERSYLQIRNGIQVKKLPLLNHVEHQHWRVPPFKVDDKIELLCQDSGIRGCWFRSTVLRVSRKQMKVQYDDLQDEDEYGNLEEWIPAFKLAAPDKLGMRCSGRPAIRPAPPLNEQMDLIVEVGSAVDAWWSDGWWEGVVTETNGDDIVQVYFPGENFFLNIHKKDLRISRDWMGDKWIGIQKKPDITSAISENVSPDTKVVTSQEIKSGAVAFSGIESPSGPKLDIIEEEKPDMETTSSDSLMEDVQYSDGGKPLLPNNDINGDGGDDVDVSHEMADKVNDNDEGEGGGNGNENGNNCDVEMSENSERKCEAVELTEVMAEDA